MRLKRHGRRISYLFTNICAVLDLGAINLASTMIIYLYGKLDNGLLLWRWFRYFYGKLNSGLPLLPCFSVCGTRMWQFIVQKFQGRRKCIQFIDRWRRWEEWRIFRDSNRR